jgi:hypothetical protein
MEPIHGEYTLGVEDLENYFRRIRDRLGVNKLIYSKTLASGLMVGLLTIGVIHLALPEGVGLSGWVGGLMMILGLLWYSVRHSLEKTAYQWALKKSGEQTPCRIQVGDAGIEIVGEGIVSKVEWRAIKGHSQGEDFLLAWLSSDGGIYLPKRGFGENWTRLVEAVVRESSKI